VLAFAARCGRVRFVAAVAARQLDLPQHLQIARDDRFQLVEGAALQALRLAVIASLSWIRG
jgi:hypothetical protein